MVSSRALSAVVGVGLALSLAACGSSSGGTSSGEKTKVDVGSAKIEVPTKLKKVVFFAPGSSNTYMTDMISALKAKAKDLGIELEVFDAGYDPTKQLNQIQSAIARKNFDAALVMPADGTVVCKAVSEQMPKAGIMVGVLQLPLCNLINKVKVPDADALWQKGTLDFITESSNQSYDTALFDEAVRRNPGPQKVMILNGPAVTPNVVLMHKALDSWKGDHPDFKFDTVEGDFTSPTAYNLTQNYLKSHPDTTMVLDVGGYDATLGAAKAIKEAGLTGKVVLADLGAADVVRPLIRDGQVQFSSGVYPKSTGVQGLEQLVAAAAGKPVKRFVDSSVLGTYKEPFFVDKGNLDEYISKSGA
jgi:ABC-type sugar transport system substrate-binding protein